MQRKIKRQKAEELEQKQRNVWRDPEVIR